MTTEWQPIETCPDERPVLLHSSEGFVVLRAADGGIEGCSHWAPLPVMPEPDPMTVVAWHPGEPPTTGMWLSPHRREPVFIYDRWTTEEGRWCALAPLLDFIPEGDA